MADARAFSGAWYRDNVVSQEIPYVGPRVWGTGINPVHMEYGEGDPLRISGRDSTEQPERSQPNASPQEGEPYGHWGYQPEDSGYTGVYQDARPLWNEETPQFRNQTHGHPPYTATSPGFLSRFRARKDGAHRFLQKMGPHLPSETVSEGWLNKPKGKIANARVSDPSQYEMQTSMRQRYETRNNTAATSRGTDDPRATIGSRVVGQKLKVYSGEERHADMMPVEQNIVLREFHYRTAGTGNPAMMHANAMNIVSPVQRVPPEDPAMGVPETDLPNDFGYTSEDYFYA